MDEDLSACFEQLQEKPLSQWTSDDFMSLVCAKCDFYKPEKEKLECGAFKILVELLKSEVISIEQLKQIQCR